MFEHLIRAFVLMGVLTFGLRGVLPELGLPGWGLMLGFALGIVMAYGFSSLESVIRYPKLLGQLFYGYLRTLVARTSVHGSGDTTGAISVK